MKILITGGKGFLAKSIHEKFKDEHDIDCPSKAQLDLTVREDVKNVLEKGNYDLVLHCATYDAAHRFSGKDKTKVLEMNLKMFFNLANYNDLYGKMIFFGSGAEYNRQFWHSKMSEDFFGQEIPEDQYGQSKFIMSMFAEQSKNIYNLRLFGLFGKYDDYRYRLIPNNCYRALKNQRLEINQDNSYDFLYINDLLRIIAWFMENSPQKKNFNVCSGVSYSFKELMEIIEEVSNKDLGILVKNKKDFTEYTGDNKLLLETIGDFQFMSMKDSITDLYQWYQKNPQMFAEFN